MSHARINASLKKSNNDVNLSDAEKLVWQINNMPLDNAPRITESRKRKREVFEKPNDVPEREIMRPHR